MIYGRSLYNAITSLAYLLVWRMIPDKYSLFKIAIICTAFYAWPAVAEEGPPLTAGMRQMTIIQSAPAQSTPVESAPVQNKEKESETQNEPDSLMTRIKKKTAPDKDSMFVALDAVQPWPYLPDLLIQADAEKINAIIKEIEAKPEIVPPRGLFYAASALVKLQRMEEAALYYYAGQLRGQFDAARFPDKNTDSNNNNPRLSLSLEASYIGKPIHAWAMQDAARFRNIMAMVREWDARTAYGYDAGYKVDSSDDIKNWPALLEKIRENYFKYSNSIADGLEKVQQKP